MHCAHGANSLKYVSWKDYKAITTALKAVYQAPAEGAAQLALERFAEQWDEQQYPQQISKSWYAHWPNLITLFDYPPEIRRVIYIESLNSVIRKATRQRKVFPTDKSALKVVYFSTGYVQKVDHANPGLEICHEPLYDRIC